MSHPETLPPATVATNAPVITVASMARAAVKAANEVSDRNYEPADVSLCARFGRSGVIWEARLAGRGGNGETPESALGFLIIAIEQDGVR